MEKKVNERKEVKEVYKCDYVYMCDNRGKEREREYKLKIQTPKEASKYIGVSINMLKTLLIIMR